MDSLANTLNESLCHSPVSNQSVTEIMLQLTTRAALPPNHGVEKLLQYNQQWANRVVSTDPQYFQRVAETQSPHYLWIGCADSRIPSNQMVGLNPAEVFVHRNVANVVARNDLNCLSVIQYAVDYVKVKTIIVCGHYGCGGVKAALCGSRVGLADSWILHVADVKTRFAHILEQCKEDETSQWEALCELNVIEQVRNVADTHVVRDNWTANTTESERLALHGWIYGLKDGVLTSLISLTNGPTDLEKCVADAVAGVIARHWKGCPTV